MKERLVELIKSMNATPEITCPRFFTKEVCKGCEFDKGNECDVAGREANYLIANNVITLPYKPFPVVLSEDENNSDVFCPFCETNLSGCYYGGDFEVPNIVTCYGCGTWIDGTKAITREEADKELQKRGG